MARIFARFGSDIAVVIHTAAQPSHDWAAREPLTDFDVNATGTLNLLEADAPALPGGRLHLHQHQQGLWRHAQPPAAARAGDALGDAAGRSAFAGIDESMSIDQTLHSLFGASKAAADLMVQEYGRYFGMKHGLLSRRLPDRARPIRAPNCTASSPISMLRRHGHALYRVFGYKGKQVRDNIHADDLVEAFWQFFQKPRPARSTTSAAAGSPIAPCSKPSRCRARYGPKLDWSYREAAAIGDHIWWISDMRKFRADYPGWQLRHGIEDIVAELVAAQRGTGLDLSAPSRHRCLSTAGPAGARSYARFAEPCRPWSVPSISTDPAPSSRAHSCRVAASPSTITAAPLAASCSAPPSTAGRSGILSKPFTMTIMPCGSGLSRLPAES